MTRDEFSGGWWRMLLAVAAGRIGVAEFAASLQVPEEVVHNWLKRLADQGVDVYAELTADQRLPLGGWEGSRFRPSEN